MIAPVTIMNPYRESELPDVPRQRRALDEVVLPIAILALGILGVVVGLAYDRATEAGLGVAATIFGVVTLRVLIRRR